MRRMLSLLLAVLVAFACLPAAAAEELPDKTEIHISTREELEQLAADCRLDSWSRDKRVYLDQNITLSGKFSPIPTFGGEFLGQGHTISGLAVYGDGSVQGLFRYIQEGGLVDGLNLKGQSAPEGSRQSVGGFAGENSGTIQNCTFEGLAAGTQNVGGIAGVNTLSGIIQNCTVSGVVYGTHQAGGIVGENAGVVRDCVNQSAVNTTQEQNKIQWSDINLSSILGNETASDVTDIGGIAGKSGGVIRSCQNQGTVGYRRLGYNVGGIAGSQTGYIVDCQNQGVIWGRKDAGGIVGQLEPASAIHYGADTFQILESQLNRLSNQVNQAFDDAVAAGKNAAELGDLQGSVDSAQDALQKVKDGESDISFDKDRLTAARNELSSNVSQVMNQTGQLDTESGNSQDLENIAEDVRQIGNQINRISSTITGTAQRIKNHDWFKDVSLLDTPDDTTAKVENCTNLGLVQSDLNAGGIVGTMGFENDADPEEEWTTLGAQSLNVTMEVRMVVTDSANRGWVKVKKQNGGGVAGSQQLGAIIRCQGFGPVDGEETHHLGGIAGNSQGTILDCAAKCRIIGDSTLGGIAGSGAAVTGCRSMVVMEGTGEELGAIAGNLTWEDDVADNYFLEDGVQGGVDSISYQGLAQGLAYQDLLALENVPEEFSHILLQFYSEDVLAETVEVEYGATLAPDQIPTPPAQEGMVARWEEFRQENICQDQIIQAVYQPPITILSAQQTAGRKAALLVEGCFEPEDTLTAQADSQEGMEVWTLDIPGQEAEHKIHFCPADQDPKGWEISLPGSGVEWVPVDCEVSGSYMIFTLPQGVTEFGVTQKPQADKTLLIGALGAVLVLLVVVFLVVKRKKKAKAKQK